MAYPVQISVVSPVRFERVQLLVRLALAVALGWLGISAGRLGGLLFLALPVIAASAMLTQGRSGYLRRLGPSLWRVLGWIVAFSAYMLLVVDRFPVGASSGVQVELRRTGEPTVVSALARLVTSIPSAIVLAVLGIASALLVLAGAVMIVLDGHVPPAIRDFQCGALRWQARLLAYHASLIDEYPPFSFEAEGPAPVGRAGAM